MKQHIIELNGKQYNALTGSLVDEATSTNTPKKPLLVDGVSRTRKASSASKQTASSIHSKTQNSQTLMRKVVKKPHLIAKHTSPQPLKHQVRDIAVVKSVTKQHISDDQRLARAQQVSKSGLISKFSDAEPRGVGQPKLAPMAVAPPPQVAGVNKVAAKPTSHLERAIDNAASHTQPKLKKAGPYTRMGAKLHINPRLLVGVSVAVVVLVIGGITANRSVPQLAVKVASARAGVHASLPSYKPSGFALNGPIQYKPGQITVSYKSNSDSERVYSVTQTTSSWDSEALLHNFVAAKNQPYQTYEENGKTIYIYNGTNATWVDGGIWYNIEGQTSLNSDQLLRLANSL